MKTMNNEQKQELATRLYLLALMFEITHLTYRHVEVKFSEPGCSTIHGCMTVACHGGWAHLILAKPRKGEVDFMRGIEDMTSFLHLKEIMNEDREYYDLSEWANEHSQYWGNTHGSNMFSSDGYEAFGMWEFDYNNGEFTLLHISNHYKKVCVNLLNDIK